jgi:phosphoribosyl 1,2-cyclic phosphodiesterase
MLRSNNNYPAYLKSRILSNEGHLSNMDCGKTLLKILQNEDNRLKCILLSHISENNNTPSLAYNTVSDILFEYDFEIGRDIHVEPLFQNTPSRLFML